MASTSHSRKVANSSLAHSRPPGGLARGFGPSNVRRIQVSVLDRVTVERLYGRYASGKYGASIGTLTASADTKVAAREAVVSQAFDAVQEHYAPELLTWHGRTALVYRQPAGWAYEIRTPDPDRPGCYRVDASCSFGSKTGRTEAINGAAHHLAQYAWSLDADDAAIAVIVRDPHEHDEFLRGCAWQRAYAHARDVLGVESDDERRNYDDCHRAWPFIP